MEPLDNPNKGDLLVAEPFLGDPSFERTVIFLTEHNEEGTLGFVLNKPLEMTINQVLSDFPDFDAPVYYGGPVQQSNIFYVHNKGHLLPGSTHIKEDIYWGGDIDDLRELVNVGTITPNDIRFFVGYSGWGDGQLASELKQRSWLVFESSPEIVFQSGNTEIWKQLLLNFGGNYVIWANSPSDPILN